MLTAHRQVTCSAMDRLTEEFKAAFQGLLDAEMKMSSNEFLQQGLLLMEKHKLLKTVVNVHPKLFLTHKENRNRLMLNYLNVHKKGAIILSIGADRKQLATALACELAPSGPTRVANLQANKLLIDKAGKLLAPINGDELYLSLACSHTVAFCKVAGLKGPTPEKALQDPDGNIDYSRLTKQPEFKAMLEVGWDWTVIPWDVDQLFPRFAQVAQKALNGSNSAASEIGELDTAVNLADLQIALSGDAEWEKAALKNVKDSCMSCAPYANVILDFVKLYGGGPGAPHITFMDSIGKTFNSTMVLGPEFWKGLTYTQFADKTQMYPLLRVACCLVNLTAPTNADNATKAILIRADLTKLATKAMISTANEAEKVLEDALELVDMIGSRGISKEDCLKPLGHIFVRVGLLATRKSKLGAEGKAWSMNEIKSMFLGSLSDLVHAPVVCATWKDVEATTNTNRSDPASSRDAPSLANAASLSDLHSATWLAKQKGFTVGKCIYEKQTEPKTIYMITRINDAKQEVSVREACNYTPELKAGKVELKCLLENWIVTNNDVPYQLQSFQLRPPSLQIDVTRTKIFNAILSLDVLDDVAMSLSFWRSPDQVRTRSLEIEEGALSLAPVVPLNYIGVKPGAGLKLGNFNGTDFFATPPGKPKTHEVKDDSFLAAFWWVGTTPKAKEANMQMTTASVNGLDIPIMKNSKKLAPYTRLLRLQAASPAKATSFKPVVVNDGDKSGDLKRKQPQGAKASNAPAAKKKAAKK